MLLLLLSPAPLAGASLDGARREVNGATMPAAVAG
jgi:hypothetical protein